MANVKRKIGFYSIRLQKNRKKGEFIAPDNISELFEYLLGMPEQSRIHDQRASKKIHLLQTSERKKDLQRVLFLSAKYNYRPNLVNRKTGESRSNPKSLDEGEGEKTHVVFKYKKDEIIALIEERNAGIKIPTLISYLGIFESQRCVLNDIKRSWTLAYDVIPKDNFLSEMNKMSRVALGEIYIDKKVLGSESLNYSNKIKKVKQNLTLMVKAETHLSIVDTVKDIFKIYSKDDDSDIAKIRVHGTNNEGNPVLLDTDIIKKIGYLETSIQDSDGVVISSDLFSQMESTLKDY